MGKKTSSKKLESITLDRRGLGRDGKGGDRKSSAPAHDAPKLAERRSKVSRRRQIDPTTCEREYTEDEIDFMRAMDDYRRTSGRMFPTCSEILEVIRSLGYAKTASAPIVDQLSEPTP